MTKCNPYSNNKVQRRNTNCIKKALVEDTTEVVSNPRQKAIGQHTTVGAKHPPYPPPKLLEASDMAAQRLKKERVK
jgi:hypothetical protein